MKDLRLGVFFVFLFFTSMLSAQEQDSIQPRIEARRLLNDKFPLTRFIDFQYETLTPSHYDSKIYGEPYEEGRIKNANRFRLAMNYPIYKTSKFAMNPAILYSYESLSFDDLENRSETYPEIYHGKRVNFHNIYASINATYVTKVFDKYAMLLLNVGGDASEKGFEHFRATLTGMMVLKRDRQTSMSVGAVVIVDPRSKIPVFPVFAYEYQFSGSEWIFDTTFPAYVYFRRPLFADGRLSLGTFLDGVYFNEYPDYSGLANTYDVKKREVKVGFTYEHYLNKHFIVSLRGGMAKGINWEVSKKSSKKAIIKYDPDPNMYFNVGFSYSL